MGTRHGSLRSRRVLVVATTVMAVCGLAAPAVAQQADLSERRRAEPLAPEQAERLCDQADALVTAGYPEEGETLYKSLLGRADCATPELVAKARAAQNPTPQQLEDTRKDQLAVIAGLHEEGFDEEARKEAQALLADDPSVDIPDEIREPTQPLGFWRDTVAAAGPVLVTGLAILTVLLVLFVVAMAARLLHSRLTHESVRLDRFDGAEKPSLPESLSGALHDHLGRLREHGHTPHLHGQSATDAEFALPATELAALSQLGLVMSLLNALGKLVPKNVNQVRGTVRSVDSKLGAGITIVLADRSGHTLAQQTVWEAEYFMVPQDPTLQDGLEGRYARLLLPAAVWLAYQDKLGFDRHHPPLGTLDWRSYALFAAGESLERDDNEAAARKAYERALDRDSGNLGAKLNLGSMLLLTGPDGLERGRKLLSAVCSATDDWTNPLPYRTRYLCAIADLYAREPKKALEHIRRLRAEMDAHKAEKSLHPLFRSLGDASRVLAESARVLQGERPELSRFEGEWTSAAVGYNLACLYTRWAERGSRPERRLRLRTALDHLEAIAGRLSPRARRHARLDPALEALRIDPVLGKKFDALFPREREPDRSSWLKALLGALMSAKNGADERANALGSA